MPRSRRTTEDSATDSRKLARELFGLFLLFWGLFVLLSLVSHHQTDPSLNHVVSGSVTVHNKAGLFGAFLSGLLADIFGLAAFVWPLFFIAWGAGCITSLITLPWWRWLGFILLAICLLSLGTAWNLGFGDVRGGGMLGRLLHAWGTRLFSPAGASLIWLFVLFISLELSFGIPWLELMRKIWRLLHSAAEAYRVSPARLAERLREALPAVPSLKSLPRLPLPHLPLPGPRRSPGEEMPDLIIDLREEDKHDDTPPAADMFGRLPGQADAPQQPVSTGFLFREGPVAERDYPEDPDFLLGEEDEPPYVSTSAQTKEFAHVPEDAFPQAAPRMPERPAERQPDPLDAPLPDPLDTLEEIDAFSVKKLLKKEDDFSHIPSWGAPDTTPHPEAPHVETPRYETPLLKEAPAPVAAAPVASLAPVSATAHATPAISATPAAPVTPAASVTPRKVKPKLPGLDLLAPHKPTPGAPPSREVLASKAERLMACLADFGVKGEMACITPGPVISMFEIRLAPGVKVERILQLSNNLAMALKAVSVRIQAPVPGSDTVGVEIPNETRAIINFRELLQDQSFSRSDAPLTMGIGQDIGGHPFTADLARMPHLLVGGATGAGKSVFLNSVLLSLLYKCTPDEVRLLLVDPKRIELAVYADLPHLVHPVVTETELAKNALAWAVHEMDNRYRAMARLEVRTINSFNAKLAGYGDALPAKFEDLQRFPYLVIIVDELADLMMTAGKEIEAHIVRLAQLARAAGIHLIVATQRPSVDVVTGLIKANFPCRIAFQVASKHDARTILDAVGAEHLLGWGDMLFKPSGGKLQRMHGAFVSDEDVVSVVDYWKKQMPPTYEVDFAEWGNETDTVTSAPAGSDSNGEDELYGEVVAFVLEKGNVSISLIQRQFRIGFNKAARFVEQMERDGIITPGDRQNKARQVNRGG